MSYARSSESGSDIYVYGARDGIHVLVAHNRGHAHEVPMPVPGHGSKKEWEAYFNDVIPFGNPNAGKSWIYTSYAECIAKIEELIAGGVGVPDRCLERLREEAREGDEYVC